MTPIEKEYFIEKFNLWINYDGIESIIDEIKDVLKVLIKSRE